jgi:hypothetical protein
MRSAWRTEEVICQLRKTANFIIRRGKREKRLQIWNQFEQDSAENQFDKSGGLRGAASK